MCFFPDEKFRKTCAELQCIRTICTLRPFLAVNVTHKKFSNIWPVVALAFLGTYSNLEYLIIVHIKISHSIHMLSIQIDTLSHSIFMLCIQIDTKNCIGEQHQIVLPCKPNEMEFLQFMRLLDTLESL